MKKPKTICVECEHHFFETSHLCKANSAKDEVNPVTGKMLSETTSCYKIGFQYCSCINFNGNCRKFKKK